MGEMKGYRLFPMIPFSPERAFDIYYVEIETGTVLVADPHQGYAEEHVLVLQGEITISIGDETFQVAREQFISFQASYPHQYQISGDEPVLAIMLISYLP